MHIKVQHYLQVEFAECINHNNMGIKWVCKRLIIIITYCAYKSTTVQQIMHTTLIKAPTSFCIV